MGLLLSYSRGAWVTFVVAIAAMLAALVMRRGGARRAVTLLVVLILGGVTLGGVLVATGSLDFLEERAQLQSYDSQRFAAQRQGIAFGEENLLGIGPGQFEVRAPVVSHNLYVRALSEQGCLGYSPPWRSAGHARDGPAQCRHRRDTYGIGSAALLGAWVGIAIESFVIDSNHWRHLWLVAALIWAGSRR